MIDLYPSVIEVLVKITEDASASEARGEASRLLDTICGYQFIFLLHLMKLILSKSSDLSEALQRKDQDILNAMDLVEITKNEIRLLRSECEWLSLSQVVNMFCSLHEIDVPIWDSTYIRRGRPRRDDVHITNEHHYRVEIFYAIIDSQLNELDDRFPEQSSELLKRVALLNPPRLRGLDDVSEVLHLAEMYPSDFSHYEISVLETQLKNVIADLRSNPLLLESTSLTDLAAKFVALNKSETYSLFYKLMRLVLTLPVSTASTERSFSALKIVKNRLRNKIGEDFLSHALLLFVEKDLTQNISFEDAIGHFTAMATRRSQFV